MQRSSIGRRRVCSKRNPLRLRDALVAAGQRGKGEGYLIARWRISDRPVMETRCQPNGLLESLLIHDLVLGSATRSCSQPGGS